MTLKQLEYFLAIAENGSITKAASTLSISQPPLSLQLKALEEELGCQLFVRDKKNMVITPKGIILRDRAKEILSKVNEAVLEIQASGDEEHSVIHIGTISSISNRVLPEKVLQIKNRFPGVEFVLHEDSTTRILDMLDRGEIQFGIVREPFPAANFNSRPVRDTALGDEEQDYFMVICKEGFLDEPARRTVPLVSLKGKPVIIHRRYSDIFLIACRQQGFAPNIICQNDNISSSLSWASSGIGIAIAPYTSAIQNTDPTLVIRKIDSPSIVSRAHLIWSKNAVLTPEQRFFAGLFD